MDCSQTNSGSLARAQFVRSCHQICAASYCPTLLLTPQLLSSGNCASIGDMPHRVEEFEWPSEERRHKIAYATFLYEKYCREYAPEHSGSILENIAFKCDCDRTTVWRWLRETGALRPSGRK